MRPLSSAMLDLALSLALFPPAVRVPLRRRLAPVGPPC